MMKFLPLFLFLFSLVRAEIELDGQVLVLNDANFDEALKAHDKLLIEFYAPWCGHCKSLAPEWAKAATSLDKTASPVKLAKVDATDATGLAKKFEIKGFPTIKYFKSGKASEYNGGRTESDIVSWVSKKSGPAAKTVATEEELVALQETADVVVVGAFQSADSANARAFLSFAGDSESDAIFTIATADAVLSHLGLSADTVVVLKSFDNKRADLALESGFDKDAVDTFVSGESTPLIQEFTPESSKKIFKSPITKHVLVFTKKSEDHHAATLETFGEVATAFKGKSLIINVPSNQDTSRILDYFGIKESDLPRVIAADMAPADGGNMKKYPYAGTLDVEGLSAFLTDFLAGNVQASLKSEEAAPEDTTGDVVVLRGNTFKELVLDNSKDVFVEFYAPWCGHCKSLAPIWEELGQKLKGSDSVVIAKMDSTANEIEVPGVAVKGFPTLYFFKGDDKSKPLRYEGAREFEALLEYVKENAHNTVSHDEL